MATAGISVTMPSATATVGPVSNGPATLPSPDPLASLIDFGNLHKVLAYILENLRAHTDRLHALENNVSTLNSTTAEMGDTITSLRNLILNIKPGGSEEDLAELREAVHVVTGRVDNQTREIGAILQVNRQHTRQLGELEESTQLLQTLMPTKANACDLDSKANKSVTDRHEREIEELQQAKVDHENRLKILENGLKRLSQAVETLVNDEFKNEAIRRITDLENQVKLLTDQGEQHSGRLDSIESILPTKAAQDYVDTQLDALMNKLRDLEAALSASMKGELKRFERDVMIYVADQLSNGLSNSMGGGASTGGSSSHSHSHMHTSSHSNTAAGKMHFRCLTCDNPRENVAGASTYRYTASKNALSSPSQAPPSDSRLLEMQLGDQIYLHGTDGAIYKGRSDPPVPLLPGGGQMLALPAGSGNNTSRTSSPMRTSISGSTSRPQSADPTRGVGRDRIDPASGRKSSELFALPLQGLDEAKESQHDNTYNGPNTQRTLFPSPTKSSARAGNSANSTSRLTLNGGGSSSIPSISPSSSHLLKSGSSSDLHSARSSNPHLPNTSPKSNRSMSRPSTATTRGSPFNPSHSPSLNAFTDNSGGGHILTAKGQLPQPKILKSKNGVEIIQDTNQDQD